MRTALTMHGVDAGFDEMLAGVRPRYSLDACGTKNGGIYRRRRLRVAAGQRATNSRAVAWQDIHHSAAHSSGLHTDFEGIIASARNEKTSFAVHKATTLSVYAVV